MKPNSKLDCSVTPCHTYFTRRVLLGRAPLSVHPLDLTRPDKFPKGHSRRVLDVRVRRSSRAPRNKLNVGCVTTGREFYGEGVSIHGCPVKVDADGFAGDESTADQSPVRLNSGPTSKFTAVFLYRELR